MLQNLAVCEVMTTNNASEANKSQKVEIKYIEPNNPTDEMESVEEAAGIVSKHLYNDFFKIAKIGDTGTIITFDNKIYPFLISDKWPSGDVMLDINMPDILVKAKVMTKGSKVYPRLV